MNPSPVNPSAVKPMSESPNKLLVVDGHSMAFRAFYALPPESFITDSGSTPTPSTASPTCC